MLINTIQNLQGGKKADCISLLERNAYILYEESSRRLVSSGNDQRAGNYIK